MSWDGSKGGSYGEGEEKMMKQKVGRNNYGKRVGRVGGTCNRKPSTLF